MKDYPAIFHLRVCRAKRELESLSSLLDKMHSVCQRGENGEYSGMEAIDTESLERMEILAESVNDECKNAKRAIEWHQNSSCS